MASSNNQRVYLTAIAIAAGIIDLIGPDGSIITYRQRGIKKIPDEIKYKLIAMGLLHRDWENFQELPSNISISFEDPYIMGRAKASYTIPEDVIKALELAPKTKKKVETKVNKIKKAKKV